MKTRMIVLGDLTDHGGAVVTASHTNMIHHKPIACVGDEVTCPSHGVNKIIEGHATFSVDGVPVAAAGGKNYLQPPVYVISGIMGHRSRHGAYHHGRGGKPRFQQNYSLAWVSTTNSGFHIKPGN